jgi:hypothetical protein
MCCFYGKVKRVEKMLDSESLRREAQMELAILAGTIAGTARVPRVAEDGEELVRGQSVMCTGCREERDRKGRERRRPTQRDVVVRYTPINEHSAMLETTQLWEVESPHLTARRVFPGLDHAMMFARNEPLEGTGRLMISERVKLQAEKSGVNVSDAVVIAP